ncbi:MAG: high frequency lysogenization protein HflD [Gammaproteobacteria bacterium]|nr:high frequency lysogenization protein HflD [Gammaproteobacteria bacterium]
MIFTYKDRVLALAGIFQACRLVQQAARKNMVDNEALEACLVSIVNVNADTTAAVYGGTQALRLGLRTLQEQLDKGAVPRDLELARYVVSVMHLERQLARQPEMLSGIGVAIEATQQKRETMAITHPEVIAQLAAIYSDTISTLAPRIIVQGEEGYLSNPETANKVRALLLAAIRSAWLWHQVGGRRWQLVFGRGAMAREVTALLQSREENPPN